MSVGDGQDRAVLVMDKVFLDPCPEILRGVEVFNVNLVRDLAGLGCRLTVVAHDSWRQTILDRCGTGVTLRSPPRGITGAAAGFAASLGVGRATASVLLLANVASRLAPAMALLRIRGVAVRSVVIAHREPTRRSLWAQSLWPSTVVAVNQQIAGHFRRAGFARVDVSYGVTDAHRFVPRPRDTDKTTVDFCLVGHLDSAWKGADVALESFRLLPDRLRCRCRLHLASFSRPPPIADAGVTVYPWMPFDRMPDFIAGMDAMLVPSRDEGVMRETFCQTLVQGMLCGLPALVSDLPVLAEKLDRGGGWVCGSAQAFAAGMERLAQDAELRRRLGEEGRATALDRYVWDSRRFMERYLFPVGGTCR